MFKRYKKINIKILVNSLIYVIIFSSVNTNAMRQSDIAKGTEPITKGQTSTKEENKNVPQISINISDTPEDEKSKTTPQPNIVTKKETNVKAEESQKIEDKKGTVESAQNVKTDNDIIDISNNLEQKIKDIKSKRKDFIDENETLKTFKESALFYQRIINDYNKWLENDYHDYKNNDKNTLYKKFITKNSKKYTKNKDIQVIDCKDFENIDGVKEQYKDLINNINEMYKSLIEKYDEYEGLFTGDLQNYPENVIKELEETEEEIKNMKSELNISETLNEKKNKNTNNLNEKINKNKLNKKINKNKNNFKNYKYKKF